MLLIFLLPFSRQAKILNINYAKHQKRMSTSRGLNMHVPSVALNKLLIILLVTCMVVPGRQGVFDT